MSRESDWIVNLAPQSHKRPSLLVTWSSFVSDDTKPNSWYDVPLGSLHRLTRHCMQSTIIGDDDIEGSANVAVVLYIASMATLRAELYVPVQYYQTLCRARFGKGVRLRWTPTVQQHATDDDIAKPDGNMRQRLLAWQVRWRDDLRFVWGSSSNWQLGLRPIITAPKEEDVFFHPHKIMHTHVLPFMRNLFAELALAPALYVCLQGDMSCVPNVIMPDVPFVMDFSACPGLFVMLAAEK